jgi:hypothetical protein
MMRSTRPGSAGARRSPAGAALWAGCASDSETTHGELAACAESVYDNYEIATGDRIALDVATLETGSLEDLAGIDLAGLLGVPATWIRMEQRGTEMDPALLQADAFLHQRRCLLAEGWCYRAGSARSRTG